MNPGRVNSRLKEPSWGKRMKPKDKVQLTPWQKWSQHRKVPWKLAVHVLLVLCASSKVIVHLTEDGSYSRAMDLTWKHFFFPDGYNFEETDGRLYTINDTIFSVAKIVQNYHLINAQATTQVEYVVNSDHCVKASELDQLPPIKFEVATFLSENSVQKEVKTYEILTLEDLQLITNDTTTFFRDLDWMRLHMNFCNRAPRKLYDACYRWGVTIFYNFQKAVNIHTSLQSTIRSGCNHWSSGEYFTMRTNFLDLAMLCIVIIYIPMLLRSIWVSSKLFLLAKRLHKREAKIYRQRAVNMVQRRVLNLNWNQIPIKAKLRFFSGWIPVSLCGALFALVDASYSISSNQQYIAMTLTGKLLLAMANLLLWIALARYIEGLTFNMHAFSATVPSALLRLAPFITGAFFVFMGFSMFGMSYFGDQVVLFKDFKKATSSLFALMNGDSIQDTFQQLGRLYPVIGPIYVVAFCICFIYLVLNIIIGFVEENYFIARTKGRVLDKLVSKYLETEAWAADDSSDDSEDELTPLRTSDGAAPSVQESWLMSQTGDSYSNLRAKSMVRRRKKRRSVASLPRRASVAADDETLKLNTLDEQAETVLLGKAHWDYDQIIDTFINYIADWKEYQERLEYISGR